MALERTRTRTVRWPEAGTWKPEPVPAGYVNDTKPAPSESDIAESRAVTEKLPTVKETP